MVWFDVLILIVIGISAGISLLRGFVREALSLVGWICAFFVAKHFYYPLADLLLGTIEAEIIRESVAWVSLFFATLLVTGIINFIIGRAVVQSGLSGTDRVMGMAFGATRGVFIAAAIVLAMLFFTDFREDAWWERSRLIPHLQTLGEWFAEFLDKEFNSSLLKIK